MTNADASNVKTSPELPTLERVYALLKDNYKPARFADRDGEIWGHEYSWNLAKSSLQDLGEVREIVCIEAFRPDGRWIQFWS